MNRKTRPHYCPDPELIRKYAVYDDRWAEQRILEDASSMEKRPFDGDLTDQVFQRIALTQGVSFAELQKTFPEEFTGDHTLCMGNYENIVLWQGMSRTMVDAVRFLLHTRLINPIPVTPTVYGIDGIVLSIPVAKRLRPYRTPRWLPVVFSTSLPPGRTGKGPQVRRST